MKQSNHETMKQKKSFGHDPKDSFHKSKLEEVLVLISAFHNAWVKDKMVFYNFE